MGPGRTAVQGAVRPAGDPRYRAAAKTAREAFDRIPRNADGGFWQDVFLFQWSSRIGGGMKLEREHRLGPPRVRRRPARLVEQRVERRALGCEAAPQRSILVFGDSLSAAYGIAQSRGWVALLEQRLAREKIAAKVVNASVSGDTTSGGRSRLPALLAGSVFIERIFS